MLGHCVSETLSPVRLFDLDGREADPVTDDDGSADRYDRVAQVRETQRVGAPGHHGCGDGRIDAAASPIAIHPAGIGLVLDPNGRVIGESPQGAHFATPAPQMRSARWRVAPQAERTTQRRSTKAASASDPTIT